jgi:hypothetical protein
MALAYS